MVKMENPPYLVLVGGVGWNFQSIACKSVGRMVLEKNKQACLFIKGQLISKSFFLAEDSPKKRTKEFAFLVAI